MSTMNQLAIITIQYTLHVILCMRYILLDITSVAILKYNGMMFTKQSGYIAE